VHFIELELSIVHFSIIPFESSTSAHLTFNKWSIIYTCFSFHLPLLFFISYELSFIISFILFKGSLAVHITSLEITGILSFVIPSHFAFSLF